MFSQTVSHDREEQPLERLRDFPSTGATILPLSDASPVTPGHSVLLASIRVTSRILAIGCSPFGLPGGKSCNSQSPFSVVPMAKSKGSSTGFVKEGEAFGNFFDRFAQIGEQLVHHLAASSCQAGKGIASNRSVGVFALLGRTTS